MSPLPTPSRERPVLALDCDEVLTQLIARLLDVIHEETGRRFGLSDVTDWNLDRCLGLTRPDLHTLLARPGLWRDLDPMPGAVDGSRILAERFDTYVVTVCPNTQAMVDKIHWIERHLPHLSGRVIPCPHGAKHLFLADVLVDDYPENLRGWRTTPVLFSRPWNHREPDPRFRRVTDWEHLVAYLTGQADPLVGALIP